MSLYKVEDQDEFFLRGGPNPEPFVGPFNAKAFLAFDWVEIEFEKGQGSSAVRVEYDDGTHEWFETQKEILNVFIPGP